ncbi:nitroreductase family protein [Candidatus Shikimatogenerans silvanidophilus]|uniref:nitroreductase family protein n=1 Tax=Candidatus Shikimatogenerans silvanidophilus TaxID=2782547 RepID=UPI001BA97AEE|nr:nitroreductase family protein [Candidatus Shikimatogenerans silvanidophilus]
MIKNNFNNFIEPLKWRYSVKKFDSKKKITEKCLNNILEVINLSPSSYGLQPYKIIIINNNKIKKELSYFSYNNNNQIISSSHLIIFSIYNKKKLNIENFVEKNLKLIKEQRNFTEKNYEKYKKSIVNFLNSLTKEEFESWESEQTYLSLGILIYYCSILKIDTCTIGGFKKDKFDEILNFKKLGLKSNIILSIGYRSVKDNYQFLKKIRKPISDIIIKN